MPPSAPATSRQPVDAVTGEAEKYYRGVAAMLDAMPERVVRFRLPDRTIIYSNRAWAAAHNRTPEEVVGQPLEALLSPGEVIGMWSQLALIGPDSPVLVDTVARPAPNAVDQWVEWVDQYLEGENGPEVLAVGRDVTARHNAEMKLAASEQRFRDLADNTADVVWRFTMVPHPHFDYMSPSVQTLLDRPAAYFVEDPDRLIAIMDDDGRAMVAAALRGKRPPERCDIRFHRPDGVIVIAETTATAVPGGFQGVCRDVTELRTLQENLASLALRDPLTGLANRRLLNELFSARLHRAERVQEMLAVAFLDLDGLKGVNDRYGHEAGDDVLCETARRLLATVRVADVVARIGGDEFVVIYQPTLDDDGDVIGRIAAALEVPIELGSGVTVRCPPSIGHADTTTIGYDADALLAAADEQMYVTKRARRLRAAG